MTVGFFKIIKYLPGTIYLFVTTITRPGKTKRSVFEKTYDAKLKDKFSLKSFDPPYK